MGEQYRHLGIQERAVIELHLSLGTRPSVIAGYLGRPRSTVMRELHRNGWHRPSVLSHPGQKRPTGGYRCDPAQARAERLGRRPRVPHKLFPGSLLWGLVVGYLDQGLSPAQIQRTLARMPDPVRLSYETIYTALYTMPRGQLRARLLEQLRRHHRARRPHCRAARPVVPEPMLIDHRPAEIGLRLVPGHWEGDLIIGRGNHSQVGTLVERRTLFVALVKLPSARAADVAEAFSLILNRFQSQMRLSMTYDQGPEMRHPEWLTASTGVQVYFAHPHSPWERGINENTNGLLRQYLARNMDLSTFTQEELDRIAWRLNTRPRKTLGWKAPAELLLPQGAFDFVQYWSTLSPSVALGG